MYFDIFRFILFFPHQRSINSIIKFYKEFSTMVVHGFRLYHNECSIHSVPVASLGTIRRNMCV